jgi:hypothetical protein
MLKKKRVGSLGAVRETQTFKSKHYISLYRRSMAKILLKRRKAQNHVSLDIPTALHNS